MKFMEKARRQKFLSFTLILFTLAVGVVIGTLVSTGVNAAKDGAAAPGATPLTIPNPVQLSTAFSNLAKMAEPSVVHISTTYAPRESPQARNRNRQSPNGEGDDMQDFFNRFFGSPFGGSPFGGPQMPGQRRGNALGSGFVVDRAGYIITNHHVIDGADRIQVKFANDDTDYDAKVIGSDPPTDIAVIRVEAKKELTPLKIGNSDSVQVGDWSVAIGSPFGFQASVTAGIISAKERDVDPTQQFQHFLQTDAAINPGNSGGPLLNINGEVIGINTAIATRTGGYQGIGFAMPINTAVNVYNQIIKTGKVTRGSIGIEFRSDSRELLRAYGAEQGVFVQRVAPGGPAEKAGLKAEDIIVAINGKPVTNGQELVDKVTQTPVGQNLTLSVLRNGKRQDLTVTIGDLAQIFPDRYGSPDDRAPGGTAEGTQARFGITIENLTDARMNSLGLKETTGVLVSNVEAGSFAEDIGLQPRDVITSINRQAVNSVDDVRRIQDKLKTGDAVAFRVMRNTGAGRTADWRPFFVAGALPETR
jgi:serine protease Do